MGCKPTAAVQERYLNFTRAALALHILFGSEVASVDYFSSIRPQLDVNDEGEENGSVKYSRTSGINLTPLLSGVDNGGAVRSKHT